MQTHLPKLIRIEDAVDITQKVSREAGLDTKEEEVLRLIMASVQIVTLDGAQMFRMSELVGFLKNVQKAIQTKDFSWLAQKRGLCVDRIVPIDEFCESPEYMNQKGFVRPRIMEKLIELFDPRKYYIEAVLTGAIGIGKNFFADMAMAYILYLLSCYHNPQLEFDLAPGSSIVFIQQSKTATLAKKVVFEQFSERLKHGKYFMKQFMFDPQIKSELRFPKQITVLPVGGSDTSALGMNVFGGVIDELNFMDRVVGSQLSRHTGEEEYDQAERLYSTIIRRMKSRFMQKGVLPGKLLLVSSRNYPGDFTDRKLEEAKTDSTIFVMNYSQWEALPQDRFSGDKFLVEVGNESKQSRIVASYDRAKDPEDVIEIPMEYKVEFERDIDAALRDLGGIAAGTRRPFIPYKEQIVLAQEQFMTRNGDRQLFLKGTVNLSEIFEEEEKDVPDWERVVDVAYLEEILIKDQPHTLHLDVGLTGDAAGLAIGHIDSYKLLPSFKVYNEKMNEFVEVRDVRAPIYMIDGAVRFVTSPGDEVDLEMIRDLALWIRGKIFIKWATMDSYQSAMLIQGFRKAGMRSGVLSVDVSIAPYAELKMAIKDERILFPPHQILAKELRELEKDRKREKVDHPAGGSKDLSDAVAGVCYILQQKEASYGIGGRRRTRSSVVSPEEGGIRKIRVGTHRRIRGGVV